MTLTRAEYHGGCIELSTATNLTLSLGYGRRLQMLTVNAAGRTLTLPPVADISVPFGANVMWVLNIGPNSFTLVDSEAYFSVVLAPLDAAILSTIDDLVGNRRFFAQQTQVQL